MLRCVRRAQCSVQQVPVHMDMCVFLFGSICACKCTRDHCHTSNEIASRLMDSRAAISFPNDVARSLKSSRQ